MMKPCPFGLSAIAAILMVSSVRAAEPTDAMASPNPLALLSKSSLKAFVEKPLFDPARSLPVVPPLVVMTAPVNIQPPEPPPILHLLGVIEGENAIAIARGPDMKTLMLHSGDHIGAWSVLVMPNGLRLSNGGRVSEYGLFTNANGKGVTPGPMPALEPAAGASPKLGMRAPRRSHDAGLQKRSF